MPGQHAFNARFLIQLVTYVSLIFKHVLQKRQQSNSIFCFQF